MNRIANRPAPGKPNALLLVLMLTLGSVAADAHAGFDMAQLVRLIGSGQTVYQAPAFELPDIEGGLVRLAEFQGQRPVLLYFWATWCPACKAARPDLVKLRERIREQDLAILAINVGSGDSLEKVKRYQQSHPLPMKVLYDNNSRVTESYAVQGIPLFVLIDKDGKVLYRDHQLPSDLSKYLTAGK